MTRQEIESTYEVRDGRIVSSGKFEREPIYTPYFWNIFLDGGADEDNGEIAVFDLTEKDYAEFPELRDRKEASVCLETDDNGFVYCY